MRAFEILENKVINLTSHDKLWVNPEKKQIILVPDDKHHTQFAYKFPEKFGLSGNLFKNYEYPISRDKPDLFDKEIADIMFNNGWVRVNVDKNEASIHCLDLKQCVDALRVLKQKYNDINKVFIDIGLEITPSDDHYILQNDEYGKGTLRIFMRTGKIPMGENIKARNVIGSAVRADEIPKKYREKYEMIGRGVQHLWYMLWIKIGCWYLPGTK